MVIIRVGRSANNSLSSEPVIILMKNAYLEERLHLFKNWML
jgi:hypothetical protein